MQAPEPCSISFFLDTGIKPWPLCLHAATTADATAAQPEPSPRPKPAVLDTYTHQLCWEKLNMSLPCLGEVLAEHTCMCCKYFVGLRFPFSAFCLLSSLCGPQRIEGWCQALMKPHHLPGSGKHRNTLLLLFLLLKAKIAHGTCNAKIPGAFWPASGMVLLMKLFPMSPVDLGNEKLALSKWTAPKYSCCVAGLVSWYAEGRQAGSWLAYQWHVLAENHHCFCWFGYTLSWFLNRIKSSLPGDPSG